MEWLVRPPAEVEGIGGPVIAVAGSGYHSLALLEDGTVVAWGENRQGQLGDGTRANRRRPVAVRNLREVVAVAAGTAHSLALRVDGSVWAWGRNDYAQLGDGSREHRHEPVAVLDLEEGASAIAAAEEKSLALRADGSVVGWGLSSVDMLGIDNAPDRATPVPGLEQDVVAIAAGQYHQLALTSSGSVLAWGMKGTAGMGEPGPSAAEMVGPRIVCGLEDVRAITAGSGFSLALSADGSVVGWGDNFFGELGANAASPSLDPVRVEGLDGRVRAIAAGYNCGFAIVDEGSAWSWGWNYQGQLGDAHRPDRDGPGPIPALGDDTVAIVRQHALRADGSVLAWGGEYPPDGEGPEAHLRVGATKLGGRPDLQRSMAWPVYDGRPLSFVAQVDLAEVAALDSTNLLPKAGLLSFFFDHAEPLGALVYAVVLSEPGTPLSRRAFPDELPDAERYPGAELRPEPELTLPPEPPPFLTGPEVEAYQWELQELEADPIHRMLGHPDIVQGDPRDDDAPCLLIQIDSDGAARMEWGDVGRLYFLTAPEVLERGTFDKVRCHFQCH